MRDQLRANYDVDYLFRVLEKCEGVGLSSLTGSAQVNMSLERDDIVGVIKKCDPSGDATAWFVDNGLVKGIVGSQFLTPLHMPMPQPQQSHEQYGFKDDNFSDEYSSSSNFDQTLPRNHFARNAASNHAPNLVEVCYYI